MNDLEHDAGPRDREVGVSTYPEVATVATVLEAVERTRIDAATGDYVATVHARSVKEAINAVRGRQVSAVLVSPRCVSLRDMPEVARLAREFPGVPMVAVLSGHDGKCSERLLQLGLSGVQTMVDLSRRDGWRRLRSFVGRQMAPMASHLLSGICAALDRPTLGTKRFFESLVVLAPRTTNARLLCKRLNVCASTFTSRFFRSCLPSPKRYLSAIRLVHAAALLQVRGLSIGDVAYRLDFSSPQSFSRHVKAVTGMTGGEFRERVSFRAALDDFASQMILPHRTKFRTFHPF